MSRPVVAAVIAATLIAAGGALGGAQERRSGPTILKDRRGDVRGDFDVVRVALARNADGRLRAEVTMAGEWGTEDLRAGGPGAAVCMRLWTRRDPTADPPDYLACVTAPKEGDELVGRVLRDRANGLPRTVGEAVVSRPTGRTMYLRFARATVGKASAIRFDGESLTHGARCPRPPGCRDIAPGPPTTGMLTLR